MMNEALKEMNGILVENSAPYKQPKIETGNEKLTMSGNLKRQLNRFLLKRMENYQIFLIPFQFRFCLALSLC